MTNPSLTERILEATNAHFDACGHENIDANELIEVMLFIAAQILAASPVEIREAWVQRIASEFPQEVEAEIEEMKKRTIPNAAKEKDDD